MFATSGESIHIYRVADKWFPVDCLGLRSHDFINRAWILAE